MFFFLSQNVCLSVYVVMNCYLFYVCLIKAQGFSSLMATDEVYEK